MIRSQLFLYGKNSLGYCHPACTNEVTNSDKILQENMMETPEPWAEVQNLGLVLKLDEPGESETVIGDEEAGNQKQI